ncbi:hypothetical protein H5410_006537 [Solanum commersonii]|uniref:Uncharacterized protein n=1 Tax=Solanum commersonii TaxID=4109 RepID=A0A9J6ABM5_SOLCO|nr:hypothetical protein H5410_006537 [Solanum commersonii]
MGGGNGQKAKMARERNLEKLKGAKGSQLDTNKKAMNIQLLLKLRVLDLFEGTRVSGVDQLMPKTAKYMDQMPAATGQYRVTWYLMFVGGDRYPVQLVECKVCMQTFMCTTSEVKCKEHAEAKHPKSDLYACFPHLKS